MNATFTKGKKTVQIYTDGDMVITHIDTIGDGFQGAPFRETVADPEELAEKMAAYWVANGYTRKGT